jgi:hypothetical protein
MRTSVTSETSSNPCSFSQLPDGTPTADGSVAFGDMPMLTDRATRPRAKSSQAPPGPAPSFFGPAGPVHRFEVSGDDPSAAAAVRVRVRLVDVTRVARLAAEDEGRHLSDDPLAWLDAQTGGPADSAPGGQANA